MIFYGVHGEGLGHSMRALSVIEMFPEVPFILFSHKDGYEYLNKNKPKNVISINKINGLEFKYKNGSVSGFTNPLSIPKIYKSNREIILQEYRKFGRNSVNLCITDWELSISRFAFEEMIPCLSIDNQHKFKFGSSEDLGLIDKFQFNIAKRFCDWIVPYATDYIVTTFKRVNSNQCHWIPILPCKLIKKAKKERENKGYDLVYCKFHTFNKIKTKLTDRPTKVYCNKKIEGKNITWYPIDRKQFISDLSGCNHLYTNAGNTLIAEALYLNVPITTEPISRHFEQKFAHHCLNTLDNKMFDGSCLAKTIIQRYL